MTFPSIPRNFPKEMRILHLHEDLSSFGGAEVYLSALMELQTARGHEVSLLETKKIPLFNILQAARKADVVHLHVVYYHTSLRLLFPLAFFPQTVLTMHDVLNFCPRLTMTPPDGGLCLSPAGLHCFRRCGLSGPGRRRDLLRQVLKRKALKRMSRIICPSRFVLRLLKHYGFPKKALLFLPHFLPALPRAEKKGLSREGPLRILYVGRRTVPKGFTVLCRALKGATFPFSALGVGSGKTGLLRFPRGILRLLPPVPRREIARFYLWAEVLVQPSLVPEAFGFSALEAAYFGCVPLMTYPGGGEDWLPEEFLLPRANPNALTKALEAFYAERERLKEASASLRALAEAFADPAFHLARLEEIYAGLLP